jgi:hypothetical protein
MNIALKVRNQPKEPGWYICHCVDWPHARPELIRIEGVPELWCHGPMSTIPLSRCEHSLLWSDRIEIESKGKTKP